MLGLAAQGRRLGDRAGHAVVEVRREPVPDRRREPGLRAAPLRVPHRLPRVQPGGARGGELPHELGRLRVRPGDRRAGGGGAASASPRSPVPVRYFAEASSASFWASCGYGLKILWVVGRYLLHRTGLKRSRRLMTLRGRYHHLGRPGVARRALIAVRVLDIAAGAARPGPGERARRLVGAAGDPVPAPARRRGAARLLVAPAAARARPRRVVAGGSRRTRSCSRSSR